MTKTILSLIVLAALALPLSACNTMEGLGKDTEAAGGAISGAAHRTKGY